MDMNTAMNITVGDRDCRRAAQAHRRNALLARLRHQQLRTAREGSLCLSARYARRATRVRRMADETDATATDPGHRIRVAVTSSDFPDFDHNHNTGGSDYEEAVLETAHNTVFHDAQRPSGIELPVLL